MRPADNAAQNIALFSRAVAHRIFDVQFSATKKARKAALAKLRETLKDLSYWSNYLDSFADDLSSEEEISRLIANWVSEKKKDKQSAATNGSAD